MLHTLNVSTALKSQLNVQEASNCSAISASIFLSVYIKKRTKKLTDSFELSRHVSGDAALDGECKDETAGVVGEQISEVLQQLAPERAAIHDVKPRLGKV